MAKKPLDAEIKEIKPFNKQKVTSTRSRDKNTAKAIATKNAAVFLLDNGLTPEQEAYARCRAFGMNQAEAITFATNGKTTALSAGAQMEKTYPLVKTRINDLSIEVSQRVIEAAAVNKGWVIDRLKKVVERCMQAEPVMKMVDGELKETGEYKFDSSGANKALELIGKELNMFQTKVTVDHNHMVTMSDAQLKAQANALAAELGLPLLE